MEEHVWHVTWSVILVPDHAMIPDSSVFTNTSQTYSLTATVAGAPSLLLSAPDEIWNRVEVLLARPLALALPE